MYKRCSTCKHCIIDLRALNIGIFAEKCNKKKHIITKPFWKGWGCTAWEKKDG